MIRRPLPFFSLVGGVITGAAGVGGGVTPAFSVGVAGVVETAAGGGVAGVVVAAGVTGAAGAGFGAVSGGVVVVGCVGWF